MFAEALTAGQNRNGFLTEDVLTSYWVSQVNKKWERQAKERQHNATGAFHWACFWYLAHLNIVKMVRKQNLVIPLIMSDFEVFFLKFSDLF